MNTKTKPSILALAAAMETAAQLKTAAPSSIAAEIASTTSPIVHAKREPALAVARDHSAKPAGKTAGKLPVPPRRLGTSAIADAQKGAPKISRLKVKPPAIVAAEKAALALCGLDFSATPANTTMTAEIVSAKKEADDLGIPDFLKRAPTTEAEKDAVRVKLSASVGPNRKISNPPNVKRDPAPVLVIAGETITPKSKKAKRAKAVTAKKSSISDFTDETIKRLVQMLKRKNGARSSEVQSELKWTALMVRRAMRDIVRKKLSHKTSVERDGRDTIYKIV